jgi:uncharacterized protein
VSHTAFSHVIDYVVDDHDGQSYHDKRRRICGQNGRSPIIGRYGYDWQELIHEEDFPLLEQPSPRLCADRLDYFLRDSRDLGLADRLERVDLVLAHLVVVETAVGPRIGVTDLDVARWLGHTFMAADDKSWANFREVGLYELTAQAIKRALVIGLITTADFWLTDEPRLCGKSCTPVRMSELQQLAGAGQSGHHLCLG